MRNDNEKEIVVAFLDDGHPWMAFATVLLKTGARLLIYVAVAGSVLVSVATGGEKFIGTVPGFVRAIIRSAG